MDYIVKKKYFYIQRSKGTRKKIEWKHDGLTLDIGNFLYKGPDGKYFRLYGVIGFLCYFLGFQ